MEFRWIQNICESNDSLCEWPLRKTHKCIQVSPPGKPNTFVTFQVTVSWWRHAPPCAPATARCDPRATGMSPSVAASQPGLLWGVSLLDPFAVCGCFKVYQHLTAILAILRPFQYSTGKICSISVNAPASRKSKTSKDTVGSSMLFQSSYVV